MKFSLVTNLKQPQYFLTFLGTALLFFDFQYYLMASLPGSRSESCVMGINFTPLNIAFSIMTSLAFALMIVGLIALFAQTAARNKASITSLSGAGFGLGVLTIFCPLCVLPALSVFGLSVGLELFNTFNVAVKILSLVLLFSALYLLNRQLDEQCEPCMYEVRSK